VSVAVSSGDSFSLQVSSLVPHPTGEGVGKEEAVTHKLWAATPLSSISGGLSTPLQLRPESALVRSQLHTAVLPAPEEGTGKWWEPWLFKASSPKRPGEGRGKR
jgi:hypothetical protein